MSSADSSINKELSADICANCGKGEEGSNSLKACTACKMVKYCNRECQIAHRSRHKRECRKRAAELHDEKLFKEPPNPDEYCPICFIRIPSLVTGRGYYACCGKVICSGCAHAPVYDNQGNKVDVKKCPFCRVPLPSSYDREGRNGYPQDYNKAVILKHMFVSALPIIMVKV